MKNNLVKNEPWLPLAVESGWQIQVDEIILNIIDEFGKPIINDNGKKMRFYPMRELDVVDYLELDDLEIIED